MCVFSPFTVTWLYVLSVQYVVSLLLASLCYFLSSPLTIYTIFVWFFVLYVFYFVYCVFVLLRVLRVFLLLCSYIAVSFLSSCKFTDHATRWKPNCSK